nr:MAG TPA: hypothetical protein [Caudoviricetes sp.]
MFKFDTFFFFILFYELYTFRLFSFDFCLFLLLFSSFLL